MPRTLTRAGALALAAEALEDDGSRTHQDNAACATVASAYIELANAIGNDITLTWTPLLPAVTAELVHTFDC